MYESYEINKGENRLQLNTSLIIFTTYTCYIGIDSGKSDREC